MGVKLRFLGVQGEPSRLPGMKLVLTLPAIVSVVGLVVYFISSHAKVSTAGLVAFGAGLLALLSGLR